MLTNRSVPANIILPHVVYQNLADAIVWLNTTFGFAEHYRYGEPVSGAQLHLGDAWTWVRRAPPACASPAHWGKGRKTLPVSVDEVVANSGRPKPAKAD